MGLSRYCHCLQTEASPSCMSMSCLGKGHRCMGAARRRGGSREHRLASSLVDDGIGVGDVRATLICRSADSQIRSRIPPQVATRSVLMFFIFCGSSDQSESKADLPLVVAVLSTRVSQSGFLCRAHFHGSKPDERGRTIFEGRLRPSKTVVSTRLATLQAVRSVSRAS